MSKDTPSQQLVEIKLNIVKEDNDINSRLYGLELDHEKLISVAHAAVAARADCTYLDVASAPGTLAYMYGTRKLRHVFNGTDWVPDRTDSIESIKNHELNTKIVFQNVDIACSVSTPPKPISEKGPSSERACMKNQLDLIGFDNISMYENIQQTNCDTYYLMVDKYGSVELSRPIIKNKTFDAYLERIFIADSDLFNDISIDDIENSKVSDDIDFDITKKKKG